MMDDGWLALFAVPLIFPAAVFLGFEGMLMFIALTGVILVAFILSPFEDDRLDRPYKGITDARRKQIKERLIREIEENKS